MKRLFLFIFSIGFGATSYAAPVDDFLTKLNHSSESITSLRGDFVQKNRLKLFKQQLTSNGRFQFQRPRMLAWEYLSPDASKLSLNQDRATLSTPGAAPQVFDLKSDATMRTIFEQLLGWLTGPQNIDRDYNVTLHGNSLELLPKPESQVARAFQKIVLRFDKTLLLQSIALTEKNGDQKEITFVKVERNIQIDPSAFH